MDGLLAALTFCGTADIQIVFRFCVSNDVSLNDNFVGSEHRTHHIRMDARRCALIDVGPNSFFLWMIVHSLGICEAFPFVYVLLPWQ